MLLADAFAAVIAIYSSAHGVAATRIGVERDRPARGTGAEEMSECPCVSWIQQQPVPSKVLIFKCSACKTDYTLYPNGQIAYETTTNAVTYALAGEREPESGAQDTDEKRKV